MNQVDGVDWPVPKADVPKKSLRVVQDQRSTESDDPKIDETSETNQWIDKLDALANRVGDLETQASDARKARAETASTSRWLNVRVMVLEEALKATESGAEDLARKLAICVESIQDQDDRIAQRLERIENDLLANRSDTARTTHEVADLREARDEVSRKLEELAFSLALATEQAEVLALKSQRTAVARLSEVEEELVGLAERNDKVAEVAEDARTQAQDSLEVTGLVIEGLEEVTDLSAMVHRIAEEARGRVEGLELGGGTDSTVKQELVDRLAEVEEEFAEFAGELHTLSEETGEVRVIAEKAHDKSEYAAKSAEALQVELEAEAEELRKELKTKVSAEEIRHELEWQNEELREELSAKASQSSLDDFDQVLARLRSQVESQLALQREAGARPEPDRPRKKWEAHLTEGDAQEQPLALPAQTSGKSPKSKKAKRNKKKS